MIAVPIRAKILVFDSGLGGLTVLRALMKQRPDADFVYAADDLGFPYGPRPEQEVVALVMDAMRKLIAAETPDCVVIACNTASTLVLPHLRAHWRLPFVGTVPAIKPAAEFSASRMISILATPGTVSRDYTRALVEKFAGHCDVTLVGAQKLATLAEDFVHGVTLDEAEVAAEIAPCFVAAPGGRRTDCVALACTHYPLLREKFVRLAPWPVHWIDPAPAIARRADHVLREKFPADARGGGFAFRYTSGAAPDARLRAALRALLPLQAVTSQP